jgi:hypothetical protein
LTEGQPAKCRVNTLGPSFFPIAGADAAAPPRDKGMMQSLSPRKYQQDQLTAWDTAIVVIYGSDVGQLNALLCTTIRHASACSTPKYP